MLDLQFYVSTELMSSHSENRTDAGFVLIELILMVAESLHYS